LSGPRWISERNAEEKIREKEVELRQIWTPHPTLFARRAVVRQPISPRVPWSNGEEWQKLDIVTLIRMMNAWLAKGASTFKPIPFELEARMLD
jgi:hypothetical protein